MLTPDLDSWTLNEESELFRRIGTKLEERYESGEDTDYAAIIYEIQIRFRRSLPDKQRVFSG